MKYAKLTQITPLILLLAICVQTPVQAQTVPTGFQEYFVLGYEQHLWDMLTRVQTGEGGPAFADGMNSVVSATASADGQVVYYDHWEDGLEADIFNPVQATTLIIGDGNDANGRACDFTSATLNPCDGVDDDMLFAGSFVNFESDGGLGCAVAPNDLQCSVPVNPRVVTDIRYDGGDYLVSTGGPLALVHPQDPLSPFIGGATEIIPREAVADAIAYTIPIGEDIYSGDNSVTEPFKYVDINIVAFDDNTQVIITSPGAGSVTLTLNRGEHYSSRGFIDDTVSTGITINSGTRIATTGPIAGLIFTGGDGTFATRFYTLLPDILHSTDYIITAPGDDPVAQGSRPLNLHIFNPDPLNAIDVTATDSTGTTVINVPAAAQVDYNTAVGRFVPAGSTVRMFSDRRFWGVSAYSHSSPANDWGHSWLAREFVTSTYTIPFAPGVNNPETESQTANRIANDADCTNPPASAGICDPLNRSPVFVSATSDNTEIQVDFDNDGIFDIIDLDGDDFPDTAPLPDNTYVIDALESLRVYDYTDYDNTGTLVVATKPVALAYGQDTDQATGPDPIQDTGYAIYPINQIFLDPTLVIDKVSDVAAVPVTTGGLVTYTLSVSAFDFGPLGSLEIYDLLPAGITTADYVPGSTLITYPDLTQSTADPSFSIDADTGRDRLDWALSPATLDANQTITVEYSILIPAAPGGTARRLVNEGHADGAFGGSVFSPRDTATVAQTDIALTKAVADDGTPEAGEVLTYTLTVANNGVISETNAVVNDAIPIGTTFVPASISSSGPFTGVYNAGQNAIQWTAASFPPGGPHTLSFQVQVNPGSPAGTTITNESSYESDQTPLFTSPEVETVLVGPALTLSKTGPPLLHPNETTAFEITVENTGAGAATNVRIVDFIPANTTYVSESMTWRRNVSPFVAVTDAADADEGTAFLDRVELLVASLGAGENITFRFEVLVDPNTDGLTISNQATAQSDEVSPGFTNLVTAPVLGNADITGHVFLDTNGNGTQELGEPDLVNVDVEVTETVTRYTCAPSLAIPDDDYDGSLASMTCCNIVVPDDFYGASPTITDLDIDVSLVHTWVGDLTIKLVSPSNSVLTLLNRPGSTAADDGTDAPNGDSSEWDGAVITFDDDNGDPTAEDMGNTIADAESVCTDDGVCAHVPAPDGAAGLTNMAGFDGEDPRGTWQLCAADSAGGDVGTLEVATLDLDATDQVAVTQTVTTDANGDYLATVFGSQVTVDVQESDPDFPTGATLSTANDPQMIIPIEGGTVAATDVGYEPPPIDFTKVSDAPFNQVVPGQTVTYTLSVTNTTSFTQTGIDIDDPLPTGTSAVPGSTMVTVDSPTFRVTEYYVADGSFTGTTFDLTLTQALASNYFAIVQGSDGDGSGNNNRGPDENYASLTQDPFGTGDLGTSASASTLRLERGNAVDSWVGVVTVVECLADCTASGFSLLSVERVDHTGTGTSGSDTSATSWSDINQVQLMGGFNGAGCDTVDTDANDTKVCHVRLFPSGVDQIEWTRDAGDATLSTATSTVMVLEWGSEWTVQRVRVQGNNGGNGANAVGEYNTAAISSVVRANTWVWGTGHTNDQGIGDAAEGVLLTLGDGVNQNATETSVAAGIESNNNGIDFEVYALTHPDLVASQAFKADGDQNVITFDVTVPTNTGERMALSYNGLAGTGNAYPRPMFSARYFDDTTIRLERRRSGQAFPAWVQGLDFSGFASSVTAAGGDPAGLVIPADGYSLAPGSSMTVTFEVEVDDPLALATTQIVNTATLTTDQEPAQAAMVTDTVLRLGVTVEPNNAGFAIPGGTVTYTHEVTNTGLVADSYELTLVSELGYTVELLDPSTGAVIATDSNGDGVWDGGVTVNTGTLNPGESEPYRVRVSVPGGAPPDTKDTTTLTAVSDLSASATAFATDETTVVDSLDTGPISLIPDQSGVVTAGDSIAYTHALVNNTGATDTFDLSAFPTLPGWTATIYDDSNGDGVYTPGIDVAISNSRSLADGELQTLFVVVDAPAGAMPGDTDVVNLTAISQADPDLFDAATDTTTIVPATTHDLSGGGTLLVDPGDTPAFPGTLKNLQDTSDRFELTVSASVFLGLDGLNHPTQLWIDTNDDGTPDTQIAEDTDGDGTWDTVDPTYDIDMDGLPDVDVPANGELAYELRRPVDALQGAYRDPITLTATSMGTGEVDSVTSTNLLAAATHAMLALFEGYTVGGQVVLEWQTTLEHRTAGFVVERLGGTGRPAQTRRLHSGLLPALSSITGGTYRLTDPSGDAKAYALSEVEIDGTPKLLAVLDAASITAAFAKSLPANGFSRTAHAPPAPRPVEIDLDSVRRALADKGGVEQLRLRVAEDGLYRVTAESIATAFGVSNAEAEGWIRDGGLRLHRGVDAPATNAGCPAGDPLPPGTLFNDGFESGNLCGWGVGIGQVTGDGVAWLGADDHTALYFYGLGLGHQPSPADRNRASIYTSQNVYWLERGTGLRMATAVPGPATGSDTTFTMVRHYEEESLPLTSVIDNPDGDFWFWDFVSVIPEFNVNVDTLSVDLPTPGKANGTARMRVWLQAETSDPEIAQDHRAEVRLNGTPIGTATWDGATATDLDLEFDSALLVDGVSSLEVHAPADSGIGSEIFYLDAVDLMYPRHYRADADHLLAQAGASRAITVEGFTRDDLMVFELADADRPRRLSGVVVEPGPGGFQASLVSAQAGAYLAMALADAVDLLPEPVDPGIDLTDSTLRGEYLVIAGAGLEPAAQALANHRTNSGLETLVVPVQSVYDTFNRGIVSPWALQDLLVAAQGWAVPPRFVVLAGDSSFDFIDRLGQGGNLIPAPMVDTPEGLFPSDHRTFDLTGDGVPEVSVGRLPVRSDAELQAYVDKLVAYETILGGSSPKTLWNRLAVWVADGVDEGGEFVDDSELLISGLSTELEHRRVYVDQLGADTARQALLDNLNHGALLVNFLGHANLMQMGDNAGLLRAADIPSLENGDRLPVLSAMTCALGRFDRVLFDTLSETLVLAPDGGVIALWAPTSFAFNEDGLMLGAGFLPSVLERPGTSLGEAIDTALAVYLDTAPEPLAHVPFTYTLLGDPAITLRP